MKRSLVLSLLLVLMLGIAACGGTAPADAPAANAPDPAAIQQAVEATVAALPAADAPAADAPAGSRVVNLYSARHYGAVEEAFERFTRETGIEVRLSQGSVQSILERVQAEGTQTPADAVLLIDAGGLYLLAEQGLLEPVQSEVLDTNIPTNLRDPEGRWFGLSQRIRTLVYNSDNVRAEEAPASYADLADPKWQGRLCLRPATHIYTLALVASMIETMGAEQAEEVVQGWVANDPQYIDSDTRILETVAAGGCDVAIVNHYYLARLLNETPDLPLQLVWANQDAAGVHRNIIGMGVLQSARNKPEAIALLEWLATEGQGATPDTLPGSNFEYPAKADAPVPEILATFGAPGSFTIDPIDLAAYGANQAAAIELLQRAGYGFDES